MKNKLILIGGSSGSGKSYYAAKLSKELNIPILQIDDIRIALQQMLNRKEKEDLFYFLDNPKYLEEKNDLLIEKLISISKTIWPAVKTIIEKHVFLNEYVIIEGDNLLPELLNDITNKDNIQILFIKTDKGKLIKNKLSRNRHNEAHLLEDEVAFSLSYNNYLISEAAKYNFEIIEI